MEDESKTRQDERQDILRPSRPHGTLDPLMEALRSSIRERLDNVLFDDWRVGGEAETESERSPD